MAFDEVDMDPIFSDLADVFFIVVWSLGAWYLSRIEKRVAKIERELQSFREEQENLQDRSGTVYNQEEVDTAY
jgi:hypothetical protein